MAIKLACYTRNRCCMIAYIANNTSSSKSILVSFFRASPFDQPLLLGHPSGEDDAKRLALPRALEFADLAVWDPQLPVVAGDDERGLAGSSLDCDHGRVTVLLELSGLLGLLDRGERRQDLSRGVSVDDLNLIARRPVFDAVRVEDDELLGSPAVVEDIDDQTLCADLGTPVLAAAPGLDDADDLADLWGLSSDLSLDGLLGRCDLAGQLVAARGDLGGHPAVGAGFAATPVETAWSEGGVNADCAAGAALVGAGTVLCPARTVECRPRDDLTVPVAL